MDKFERDIINVLYEADRDCIAQIVERNKRLGSELHVLPYCLSNYSKTGNFNINYDPYTSSLLDFNSDYNSYYFFYRDHDYIISEATKVMESRSVELLTVDYIFKTKKIAVPLPDFFSIDTQGSEYEILEGAKETLKSNVVALVIEVGFCPFYAGQKLFGELSKFLSDLGFDFVKFLHLHQYAPYRAPIGLRGEGFQTNADALFLRRVRNIENMQIDEIERRIMLQKLAFIAILFNQFEYALQSLGHVEDIGSRSLDMERLDEPTYFKFLRELKMESEKMPKIFPPTFASKYTFEASSARFRSSANSVGKGGICIIKELLKKIPFLFLLLRSTRYPLVRVKNWINRAILFLRFEFLKRYTGIESVMIDYGFKDQAKILMKNRIVQSSYVNGKRHDT